MNKLTAQIQTVTRGGAYKAWARAVWPKAIKVLEGGIDLALLHEMVDHGLQQVVLRKTNRETSNTSEAPARVASLLQLAQNLVPIRDRGVQVVLEFPYNEESQTSPEAIKRLSDATLLLGPQILAAGWDLAIGVFSEGNPSNLAWWDQFYPALRWAQTQWGGPHKVFLGLHEYSTPDLKPPGPFDGWHEGRYRRVWAQLPEECKIPILITEGGIDGGTESPPRREQGWRAYYPDAKSYLPYMRRRRAEFAKDAYVWWVYDFLIGSEQQWQLFDLGDEVDLRPAYLESEAGPPLWSPSKGSAPMPVVTPLPDWCPFATVKPIQNNFNIGRSGGTAQLIVNHITAGYGGLYGWFNNPNAKASTHLWISREGELEQYVKFGDMAWANGRLANPDIFVPLIKLCVDKGYNPNDLSISIEHEGMPGDEFTPKQIAMSIRVHEWLFATFSIPRDRQHVLGHYQFDNVTRAGCPGAKFPWAKVIGKEPSVATFAIAAVRDQLWALGELLSANGYYWTGMGVKAVVALSKGEK